VGKEEIQHMGKKTVQTKSPPLMENEHVKELLSIMEANNLSTMKDLLDVIGQVGALERQLDNAVNELGAMRRDLETMRKENHPLKTAMQNAVIIMQDQVIALRECLTALKQNVIDGCKNAVAAFKEKGISALRNIADFFKLRPGLEALRDNLNKSIKLDEAAMAKIEAVSAEYHKAGRHIGNMGRALVGKEAVAEAKAPGKLAAAITAPYRAERSCLMAARRHVNAAINGLTRLEQTAERKPPIMETINKLNEQIAQAKKDAPAVERPRPVTHEGR